MKRYLTLAATVVAAGLLLAQPQQYPQNPQGPPNGDDPAPAQGEPDGQYEQGRAVARLSFMNGEVSMRRGDSGEVIAAALNTPLLANDALLTGNSSRAEIQLDYGKVLRVGPNSEVRFAGLDIHSFQIQVAAGTVTFRVLRSSDSQAEIDTPSIAIQPVQEGVYRISVREDGTSEITVRAGLAEIGSPKGTEQLGPGRTMYARGDAADPEFQVVAAIGMDGWDRWNDDRDRYLQRSQAYQHVSRDIYGAEDLDQYGQWVSDPSYGEVWQPAVAPGWAPYQSGRWVWEDWYGWTWVSYDPWGWAPYHYGRWFWGARGWCWYPGAFYGPHFWAPAYVAFFGWGGHVGFGFGFGGVGWVPLAPFERFHPWWGRGFYGGFRGGFGNHLAVVNNVNITNVYRNARVTGGVTGVNAGDFGRHTAAFQSLNHAQIQQTGLVRGTLPVAPDRASLRVSDRNPSGNFPRSNFQNFAGRTSAPRVDRVPFEQQQRGMQQVVSRGNFNSGAGNSGVGVGSRGGFNPGSSNNGNFRPNNNPGAQPSNGGWPRVNNNPGSANPSSQPGAGPANHGWGSFGQPIHGTAGASTPSAGRSVDGGSNRPAYNGGWQRFDNARPNNFAGGGSQPVRISPPIVQQRNEAPRNYNPQPSYQAPRNYSPAPSYQAPRSYSPPPSAPRNYSSPAPRGNSGGGGGGGSHSNGGGGGSHGGGGGGSHGGHR